MFRGRQTSFRCVVQEFPWFLNNTVSINNMNPCISNGFKHIFLQQWEWKGRIDEGGGVTERHHHHPSYWCGPLTQAEASVSSVFCHSPIGRLAFLHVTWNIQLRPRGGNAPLNTAALHKQYNHQLHSNDYSLSLSLFVCTLWFSIFRPPDYHDSLSFPIYYIFPLKGNTHDDKQPKREKGKRNAGEDRLDGGQDTTTSAVETKSRAVAASHECDGLKWVDEVKRCVCTQLVSGFKSTGDDRRPRWAAPLRGLKQVQHALRGTWMF